MTRHYTYLLVGGGMSADSAARGIRESDPTGSIGLISQEQDAPYNRPPLSKGLWKKQKVERIFRQTANLGVDLHLGRKVVQLDPAAKTVTDDQGDQYSYEKLLLATGGDPIRLPYGGDAIIYYRTLSDYQRLRALAETKEEFIIIGGGFIGAELAAALTQKGKRVTMIFPEDGLLARVFPRAISTYVTDYFREQGVRVILGQTVVNVLSSGERLSAQTSAGEVLLTDGVVAGIGIRPSLDLAKQAGLQIENGIIVDANMTTSHPDIYAAGDVAAFFNSTLNKRMRVEHEENANLTGLTAGRAMAGHPIPYDHMPYMYSDLFEIGFEAVGEINPTMPVIADWQELYKQGVIYFMAEQRVRGVLTWGMRGKLDLARQLIADPGPFNPNDLVGKIVP